MDKPTTEELARFLNKVQITKSCWLWIGCLYEKGYGHLGYRGRDMRAHRFSYRVFVGPIEPGKQILHRRECGNRNCVNPHHLYMGTHADNMKDRDTWGNPLLGEACNTAKLTEKDVLTIRRIRKERAYTYKVIADMFGVHPVRIGCVIRGDSWKHLPI